METPDGILTRQKFRIVLANDNPLIQSLGLKARIRYQGQASENLNHSIRPYI
jgi:hypothetical protein